jgi:DNA-binding protein HU-beta
MTKADLVTDISDKTGVEKIAVQATIETFMQSVIEAMENGENVYLRGFGSFIVKKRAEKTARNIKKNTTIKIPAHNIPAFKPSRFFIDGVKTKLKIN